jgi:uncharacterized membrane protein YkoI
MQYAVTVAILVASLWSAPAWALFESNKELADSARIPMDQAVKAAVAAVPGKAVEAELGKEDGRVAYEIEIIDNNKTSRTVYIDAQSGKTMKVEK